VAEKAAGGHEGADTPFSMEAALGGLKRQRGWGGEKG